MSTTHSVLLLSSLDPRRLKTARIMLPFGDRTVLRRTVDAYLALSPREIVLVSAEPTESLEQALGAGAESVTVVSSPEVRGRVGLALRLGLERLADPEVLIVGLGDQPLLRDSLLAELAKAHGEDAAKIGVPVCQGIPGHPLFVPRRFLDDLRSLEPEQTHRRLLLDHAADVLDIETDETAVLRTIEDPESYKTLLAIAGLPAPAEEPDEELAPDEAPESTRTGDGPADSQTAANDRQAHPL